MSYLKFGRSNLSMGFRGIPTKNPSFITEIVNTLKNISMVMVDPNNVQECIPKLRQKIGNITLQWE